MANTVNKVANPYSQDLLKGFVYPVGLAVITMAGGIYGNYLVYGSDVKVVKEDIHTLKVDVHALKVRQDGLEAASMDRVMKLVMDCEEREKTKKK